MQFIVIRDIFPIRKNSIPIGFCLKMCKTGIPTRTFHFLLDHAIVLVYELRPYSFDYSMLLHNLGQRFALLEEKVFLSTVIRRFHLATTQTFDNFVPAYELVLRSGNELKVKLTPRRYKTE